MKKKYLYSTLVAGCLCALTSIGATRINITSIPAFNGIGSKTGVKSTSDQYWTSRFYADGKINTMKVQLSDSTGNYSIAPTLFPTEGEPEKRANYTRNAGKGTTLKVYYSDYHGNVASYTCNGYADIR